MFSYFNNQDFFGFHKQKQLDILKNLIYKDLYRDGKIMTDLKLSAESFFPTCPPSSEFILK